MSAIVAAKGTTPERDRASTHDLSGAIAAVLPALERFVRFDGPDPPVHHRPAPEATSTDQGPRDVATLKDTARRALDALRRRLR